MRTVEYKIIGISKDMGPVPVLRITGGLYEDKQGEVVMSDKNTYLISVWVGSDDKFLCEVTIEEDKLEDYVESKIRPYVAKVYDCSEEELCAYYGWETVGLRDLENL